MVWSSRGSDLAMAGPSVVVSGRRTPAGRGGGWIGARPASLICRGMFQSVGMPEAKENEEKPSSGGTIQLFASKVQACAAQPHTPMSPSLHPNTQLALLAVVSALIVLKVAKRAPKKPLLLTDLKDAASQGTLSDLDYDIIIVGGGESLVATIRASPSSDSRDRGLRSRRSTLRGARSTSVAHRVWGEVTMGHTL